MTAEEAARAFFEACAKEDWNEAGKFMSPVNDELKEYLGGLEIRQPGQSLHVQGLRRPVCPLRNQTASAGVQPAALQQQPGRAIRHYRAVRQQGRSSMQDLSWTNAPEVLPDERRRRQAVADRGRQSLFRCPVKAGLGRNGEVRPGLRRKE